MKIHSLSVEAYQHIAYDDRFNATETIVLGGRWPITVGTHPDFFPDGPILIGHVQDRAFLVTLDQVPDFDPEAVEPAINPKH